MNRRGFLGSILAACAAPAIVRADSLMRLLPVDAVILRPGGNTLLTFEQIQREALHIFEEQMRLATFPSPYLVAARLERLALAPKAPWRRP